MSATLKKIREANPAFPIRSVEDPEFARYGRILECENPEELSNVLIQLEIPKEGNTYVASCAELEHTKACAAIVASVFGESDVQSGYCNGHGYRLNALEYHKSPEVNYSTTGAVLFLGRAENILENQYSSAQAEAYYLPSGVMIELAPLVLHFAPCRLTGEGFNCLVMLPRGTNEPLEGDHSGGKGEEALLFMKNKWLIAHRDSPSAKNKNTFLGITGENFAINPIG